MKSFYMLILGCLTGAHIMAQITLTESNSIPDINTQYTYYTVQSPAVNIRPGGSGQTWDLSFLSGSMNSYLNVPRDSASDKANFPTSNFVQVSQNLESYYKTSVSEFTYLGGYFPGAFRTKYSNERITNKFPFAFNDVFTDAYSGQQISLVGGSNLDIEGNVEVKADGEGILKLPNKTITSVLRIRTINSYIYKLNGDTLLMYIDSSFAWYDGLTKSPLASVNYFYIDGSFSSSSGSYIDTADITAPIDTNTTPLPSSIEDYAFSGTASRIHVYPNPVRHELFVQLHGLEGLLMNYTIYNTSGSVWIQGQLSSELPKIDCSNLETGVYFIKVSDGKVFKTLRFIKN